MVGAARALIRPGGGRARTVPRDAGRGAPAPAPAPAAADRRGSTPLRRAVPCVPSDEPGPSAALFAVPAATCDNGGTEDPAGEK
ncbi:hypothetical protein Sfr7A_28855 [Streptomyces xinghaiensis]|uniref:Uncharacterized protein n=1 Tax=Streptomyces xinghaiensis TaxID=1038928 RepID=A0A3R7ETT1_9ACTN|nr:hypothetical protein BEN35_25465 [Streptomyces fradiae]PQM20158.1 hypothetical protein Sfr7A_28855 [Streptomyces xinghaiensis]RKM96084.1 hypothetical protein SFRA_014030 [Streptomyces xinghaiensis]RNC70038.1 hypothetical protein DC095_027915 [Streptomyces xinghaiensis]